MGVRWAHWGVAQSLEPSPSHSKFAAFKYERKKKTWQKRTNLKWRKKKCQASGYLKVICLCRIFNDLFGGLGKIVKRSFLVVPRRSWTTHVTTLTTSLEPVSGRGRPGGQRWVKEPEAPLDSHCQAEDNGTTQSEPCAVSGQHETGEEGQFQDGKLEIRGKKTPKQNTVLPPPSSKMSLKLNRHLLGPHQSVLVFIIIFFQIFVWSEKVWSIHVRKFTFTELFTERILKVPHSKIWKEKENTGYWI